MKKVILMCIILIFLTGYGVKSVEKDELIYKEENAAPYSSEVIIKDEMFESKIQYKNGKKDGITTVYLLIKDENNNVSNKILFSEENYKDDILDGLSTYYKDEKVYAEINYINGIREGVAKYYYGTGEYIEDALKGIYKFTYLDKNDQIIKAYESIKGNPLYERSVMRSINFTIPPYPKRIPEHPSEFTDKQLAREEEYKNGELNGKVRIYHRSSPIW
jgi:antitoxin component YwqK of YwqJK toxin-antitoxin module